MKNISKIKKRIIIFMLLITTCVPVICFANPMKTSLISDKTFTWAGGQRGTAKWDLEGVDSAPPNVIYGDGFTNKIYYGEESTNVDDTEYRSSQITSIAGKSRNISVSPTDTNDSRAVALGVAHSKTITNTGSSIYSMMACLGLFPIKLAISISNVNLSVIIDTLITNTDIADALKRIFIVDDTGKLSPFLAVFLILWIFGLIVAVFKFLKGASAKETLITEIVCLLISLFCFAMCCYVDFISKTSEIGTNIVQNVKNTISGDIDTMNENDFWKATGSGDQVNGLNEYGIASQAVYDNMICAFFAVDDVTELDDPECIAISNGAISKQNIGYSYIFGDSVVDYSSPISGGKLNYNSPENNDKAYYFIADAIKDYSNARNKKVFAYITSDNKSGAFGYCFILFLYTLFFGIVFLIFSFVYCVVQVACIGGAFVFYVVPALVLFKNTRQTAKKVCFTILSFLVMAIMLAVVRAVMLLVFQTFSTSLPNIGIGSAIFAICLFKWKALLGFCFNIVRDSKLGRESYFRNVNNFIVGSGKNIENTMRKTTAGLIAGLRGHGKHGEKDEETNHDKINPNVGHNTKNHGQQEFDDEIDHYEQGETPDIENFNTENRKDIDPNVGGEIPEMDNDKSDHDNNINHNVGDSSPEMDDSEVDYNRDIDHNVNNGPKMDNDEVDYDTNIDHNLNNGNPKMDDKADYDSGINPNLDGDNPKMDDSKIDYDSNINPNLEDDSEIYYGKAKNGKMDNDLYNFENEYQNGINPNEESAPNSNAPQSIGESHTTKRMIILDEK